MNKTLLELLTTRKWMVAPSFAHSTRMLLQSNMAGHIPFKADGHVAGQRIGVSALAGGIDMARISTATGRALAPGSKNEPYINLLNVTGPITRNGDLCSYGSIDHRDMIMQAADDEYCMGHVFLIDTPGGSAWAKNDYRQAIDYAHSKNQPVYAFIDGMCASAGVYLASMCDARYYMNPNDEFGCIGVMAAFYTQADGSKNQYTDETYHEYYDPESFDKNKAFRDIANDDDAKLLIDELAELGSEFRADVQAAFPKATDDHIHGKVFKASEVEGIFLDGQSTLGEVFGMVIDHSAKNGVQAGMKAQSIINNKHNTTTMNDNYQTVAAACGVEELVVTEEGTHLDLSLVQNLQQTIEGYQTTISTLTTERDQAQAERDKAQTENESNTDTVATLNDTIAQRDAQVAELQQQVSDLTAERDNLNTQLTEAQQTISDRDATIAELTQQPGEEPAAGASPENNGMAPEAPHLTVGVPQQQPGESRKDFLNRVAEYRKARTNSIKSKTNL